VPLARFNDSFMRPEIKTEIPSLKLRLVREEDAEELSLRVDQNREYLQRWASWVDGTTTTSDTRSFGPKEARHIATSGMGERSFRRSDHEQRSEKRMESANDGSIIQMISFA